MKTSKNSRLALSIAGALCSLPLFLTNAHAFGGPPGGPFSNGSYFPNDGTFSAVVRGGDLTGTMQFSTSSTANANGAGSTGVSSIYYDGYIFSGNSQGALDPSTSSMAVTFECSSAGQAQNNFTTENATTLATTVTRYIGGIYLGGYADCNTSNSYPNQKFTGTGNATVKTLNLTLTPPSIVPTLIAISLTGVRLSNTSSSFTTRTITPPSVVNYTTTTP